MEQKKRSLTTRIVTVILLLVMVSGVTIGLSVATKGFTDWDVNNWGNNFQPKLEDVGDVASGILASDKYGTFVIPEGNMFATFGYGALVGFPSGTDLTYINTYITSEYNKLKGTDYSDLNYLYSSYSRYSADVYKDNAILLDGVYNHSSFIYFSDNMLRYDIKHQDIIMGYQLDSFVGFAGDIDQFYNAVTKRYELPLSFTPLINAQDFPLSLHCRVLSRRVTVTGNDNQSMTMYLPTCIISDLGVPLTYDIYNEITNNVEV